jgi:acetyl-CoA synthetase
MAERDIDLTKFEDRLYDIPKTRNTSHISSLAQYYELRGEASRDPDNFWLGHAKRELHWNHEPSKGFEGDFSAGKVTWFNDGTLNVAYNCIDRHPSNSLAIIWEGDEPGQNRHVTFGELHKWTCQLANYLQSVGVQLGDRVTIYMPMVVETVIAMLACARLGAIHNVVFAGFSSESLADRILDSASRIILTADEGVRGGKIIHLKNTVDKALSLLTESHQVEKVLVYRRTGAEVFMKPERDYYWDKVVPEQSEDFEPIPVPAEHPLFMLYTSGSTGKPKGLVHSSAGYLLYATLTFKYVFDHHPGDIYGCLADVGWITGHSYIVYGPLCQGATTVLFESIPTYPNPSRYWDVIQRLRITQLYTAPTVIRALKRFGNGPVEGFDLSSLRILGTVGEPINPDAWVWYHDMIGKGNCAIVDTYWQTETGGHVITPLPFAIPTKAGSATFPFLGIEASILDQHNGTILTENDVNGVLTISRPWPGMARTIYGDHSKFVATYFQTYPGHYFSGDRAHRDRDGYFWIRGRVDDVINVSGHRLSTAEIEAALGRHPLCAEAAVLGRADEITGQSIWAFCIIKPAGAEMEPARLEIELKATVRNTIGSFSTPRRIILIDDLPKTRSGKIMRRVIRKILEGVTDVTALGDTTTLNNPAIIQQLVEAVHLADHPTI